MKKTLIQQLLILIVIVFSSICAAAQMQAQKRGSQVAILSRPNPIYTEIARKNKVEGTVRLKVVFLASGEVGDITFVSESSRKKKLAKAGLVEKAIEAARNIKFEPAKRKGKPVTTVATVEYTFRLIKNVSSS